MATLYEQRNKDGVLTAYRIRIFLSEDASGKQIKKQTTFKVNPNWKEETARKRAETFAANYERDLKEGKISTDKRTFDDYAKYVIELKETNKDCKTTTLDGYKIIQRKLSPFIGSTKLKDLTTKQFNQLYLDLQSGKLTGRPQSAKTIRNIHGFISTVLEQAISEKGLVDNAAHRAKLPKLEQRDPETLELDQLQTIFEYMEHEPMPWRAAILILINTGIRRGELFGLKWDKVNLTDGTIEICNNMIRCKETHELKEESPKTKTSNRIIRISSDLVLFLEDYKEWQAGQLGEKYQDNGFVIARENGAPINPDMFTKYCWDLTKKIGFHVYPHLFRHTQASILIASGQPVTSVQKRLGHSQASTTMNIYAHALRNADEENVRVLENVLYNHSQRISVKEGG